MGRIERMAPAVQVSGEAAHERLVTLVRGRSRARLELGRAVDALARRSGHRELGYSSVGAYVLQRTGLSTRLVEESRTLVRRLFDDPGLPELADALGRGRISWSAAVRVAAALKRVAREAPERLAEEERAAVEAAGSMTVRRLERWLADRQAGQTEQAEPAAITEEEPEEREDRHLLQRTMSAHARELLESTRMLIGFMDGPVSDEHFVEALLAEAHSAMMDMGPDMARAFKLEASRHDWAAAHGDVIEVLRRARAQADERRAEAIEARVARRRAARGEAGRRGEGEAEATADAPLEWASLEGWSIQALDARVVEWADRLARRDLELADAALVVCAGRFWRRLGWNTQAQYAREELGMSVSALRTIIARARRMIELPELRDAVEAGRIGLVAASAIGRVATPDSVDAWIDRAGRRTVVHLREEVRAVELLARGGSSTDFLPPSEEQLEAVRAFERGVASGDWFEALMDSVQPGQAGEDQKRQMSAGEERADLDLDPDLDLDLDPGQRPAPLRAAIVLGDGSLPHVAHDERLRLRISDEQAGWWRYLERAYARHERILRVFGDDSEPMSFVEFACVAVWLAWYPSIKATGQFDRWTSVYLRDRYRCSSPVCSRRDVTPHHLRFQSHGGGHEDENLASLCSWCHLEGVHGGRIKARPPASKIHWWLGRDESVGVLEVRGRELVA